MWSGGSCMFVTRILESVYHIDGNDDTEVGNTNNIIIS